jgi:hypothetical protein
MSKDKPPPFWPSKPTPLVDVGNEGTAKALAEASPAEEEQPSKPTIVRMTDKPDPMQVTTEAFRRELPFLIERAALMAQMRRAYYLAYMKEGFTAEEALKLCVM